LRFFPQEVALTHKWEYLSVTFSTRGNKMYLHFINDEDLSQQKIDWFSYLNKLGEEGWELVNFSGAEYVFKRQKAQ